MRSFKFLLLFLSLSALSACSNPGRGVAPPDPDFIVQDGNLEGLLFSKNWQFVQGKAEADPFQDGMLLITLWSEFFEDPCSPMNLPQYRVSFRIDVSLEEERFSRSNPVSFQHNNQVASGDLGIYKIEEVLSNQMSAGIHIKSTESEDHEVNGNFTVVICQ